MIADLLVPRLAAAFPHRGLLTGSPPDPIATFPAAHHEVGDLTIRDDGDEATVSIGRITHHHFNPYDDSLSQGEIDETVTGEVLDFLSDLFADQILLWTSGEGRAGGMIHISLKEHLSELDPADHTYTWSGPVTLADLID